MHEKIKRESGREKKVYGREKKVYGRELENLEEN